MLRIAEDLTGAPSICILTAIDLKFVAVTVGPNRIDT